MKAQFKAVKKDCKVYIRQYVNREWTVFNVSSIEVFANPADGSPGNPMEFVSNDEAECQLPDGRFRLTVYDYGTNLGSHPLYFDRVTLDGKELKPTKIDGIEYIYEYEAPRDGAVIGVWYHTED